jgi:hypothetical protein
MTQLVPCPQCNRHVRKTESRCPFCGNGVSLAHVPSPVLPSRRLGRAATFAFGATFMGATSIAGCSDDNDGPGTAIYGGPPAAGAGGESFQEGGASAGGADTQPEGGMTAIYGSPPGGGAGGQDQQIGGSGPVNAGGEGGAATAIYGGPPGGAGGEGGGG